MRQSLLLLFASVYYTVEKLWLMATRDTGGEVEDPISGRLLHHPFEGRGAGLFRRFSPQPTHQLNESDCGGNSHMAQMGFAQTDIPRAA